VPLGSSTMISSYGPQRHSIRATWYASAPLDTHHGIQVRVEGVMATQTLCRNLLLLGGGETGMIQE